MWSENYLDIKKQIEIRGLTNAIHCHESIKTVH
jgi:hypothetical protein